MANLKACGMLVILVAVLWTIPLYYFRKKCYRNDELFVRTPEHDMKNVEAGHAKAWKQGAIIFYLFPFILMVFMAIADKYATETIVRMLKTFIQNMAMPMLLVGPYFIYDVRTFGVDTLWDRSPYITTRYMVYPEKNVSCALSSMLAYSAFGGIAGFVYPYFESNITIRNGLDFPFGVLCFVLEIVLVFFANYAIIGGYDNTSRDFLFDNVEYSDYDKAAKRYYGIWRNRLILANAAAGAQLILGGFVTLTNAGEHLAGIRYLGIVVLVIVFSYILIQSRDFDAPIIVKGMVYPSEKKRITLRWVVLASIAVYILGTVILL